MGIIRTDHWLDKEFNHPAKICERILPFFNGLTAKEIYDQLLRYGMYRPSLHTKRNFEQMRNYQAWDLVGKILRKYKDKWSGPDIPIFLFPLDEKGGLFRFRTESRKSGVSYPDKMFLFLSVYDNLKEIEALFVHEYHHVCRLNVLNKNINNYTLLDSIIIEGLAEYAVLKNCGEAYIAKWCHMYSERELSDSWDRFFQERLDIKKNEQTHDELLYGGKGIPPLIGYAMGYQIVKEYYKKKSFSEKLSFRTKADRYID